MGPAGSASGQFVYTSEYPSFEDYGRYHEALRGDPDLIAARSRLASPDAPMRIVHHALYAELPK
jgi:hypothetical protein